MELSGNKAPVTGGAAAIVYAMAGEVHDEKDRP